MDPSVVIVHVNLSWLSYSERCVKIIIIDDSHEFNDAIKYDFSRHHFSELLNLVVEVISCRSFQQVESVEVDLVVECFNSH